MIWVAGVAGVLAARAAGFAAPVRERAVERGARAALAALCVYGVVLALANAPAERAVRAALEARGAGPVEDVMIGPRPANPLAGDVVAVTPEGYHFGRWRWQRAPRLTLERETVPRPDGDPLYAAAAATVEAQRFLTWSRFPYVEVEAAGDGHVVRFRDARYRSRDALGGPAVRLDAKDAPVAVD